MILQWLLLAVVICVFAGLLIAGAEDRERDE